MEEWHAALHPGHLGRHRHDAGGLDVGDEPCESARTQARLRCTATDAAAQWPQIPRIDNTYDKNVDRSPLCEGKGFPQGPTGNLGCRQFKSPACDDDTPWHPVPGSAPGKGAIEGRCSGDFLSGSIVDHVVIPSSLPAGDYIVGFRWE